MNILIYSVTFEPYVGGAEIAVKEIANRLPHIRFDLVTLRFDTSLPKHDEIGNIHVHRVGFAKKISSINDTYRFPLSFNKYLFPLFALFETRRLLKTQKYDFIWSIMANYAGFAALAVKTFFPKIPFLLTLQEGDPLEYIRKRVNIFYPFFKRIFLKADSIQAISAFLAHFAIDMGYSGTPVIVPNGVDLTLFMKEYSALEKEALKRELEKEIPASDQLNKGSFDQEIRIITVSRLVEKNGIGSLIASLTFLPGNFRLIIIGDGPLQFFLKSRASELGLDGRIYFLGQIPYEEIPKYLSISDVFVRPALSEGFGNAFIEAMAAGLPIIGTEVGGIPDFLKDPFVSPNEEPTGLFCKPGAPETIAEEIRLLVENKELRERLIKNGRKLAETKYDWRLIALRMEKDVFAPLALKQK